MLHLLQTDMVGLLSPLTVSPISTPMFLHSFYPIFHLLSLLQTDFISCSTVVATLCSSFPSMSLPKWPGKMFSFIPLSPHPTCYPSPILLHLPLSLLGKFWLFSRSPVSIHCSWAVCNKVSSYLGSRKREKKNLHSTNDIRKVGTFIFLSGFSRVLICIHFDKVVSTDAKESLDIFKWKITMLKPDKPSELPIFMQCSRHLSEKQKSSWHLSGCFDGNMSPLFNSYKAKEYTPLSSSALDSNSTRFLAAWPEDTLPPWG